MTESSAGKPPSGSLAIVSPNTSRTGMSGAIQAVANAPAQTYMHTTGGKNKPAGT